MDVRPQRQHPAIGVPEVCSDVALPRHQGRHAMPELVRGRPRDASGPSGWIEHAPTPVPRVLQRSGRRGEHGVTVAPQRAWERLSVRRRAMSEESGTLRRPASVLDTAIRAEGRPSASGPTSHQTFSASEMRHPVEARKNARSAWAAGMAASRSRVCSAVSHFGVVSRAACLTTTRTPAAGFVRSLPSSYAVASSARTGA